MNLGSRLQPLQLLLQKPGAVLLKVNLSLEVFRRQFQELMRIARVAVAAAELAAAVGIDGVGKGRPRV